MIAAAYKRWSLTRDSKYSDLTWKLLAFRKTGHWGEVIATCGSTVHYFRRNIENLMTGSKETVKLRGTLGSRRNKTHCFLQSQSLSILSYLTSHLKNKKNLRRNHLLEAGWLTNLPWFQGAWPDRSHASLKFKLLFPLKFMSFVCPKEFVSFDPQHVTSSPPIRKRIWVEGYNKYIFNTRH